MFRAECVFILRYYLSACSPATPKDPSRLKWQRRTHFRQNIDYIMSELTVTCPGV